MSKLKTHAKRKEIDTIILTNKFKGLGSVEIQKEIALKTGVQVSRPTIDKHYKENMNGDLIDALKQDLIESTLQYSDEIQSGIRPSYCEETERKILNDLQSQSQNWYGGASNVGEVLLINYAKVGAMIQGNVDASIRGVERLKPELLKYFKELRDICRNGKSSF